MSTLSMDFDSRRDGKKGNREDSQRVAGKQRFCSTRPIAVVCERIFRDWLRGVTERSLSIMYRLTRPLVEEVLRDQTRLLARASARMALVLVGLVAYGAWDGMRLPAGSTMARAFRSRRGGRRRGLEDSGGAAVEHARLECRGGAAVGAYEAAA